MAILTVGCSHFVSAPEPDPVTAWLADNAVPLTSVEAGSGFEDLRAFAPALKNVRVLGLGEASHGQREFFQAKHRLMEFLVAEMGYSAFSLEASYPACMKINDYVVHGTGDPRAALAGQGFNQFDTEEVLAMIEWMRRHNAALPEARRVKFLGYDMQAQYHHAFDAITAFLRKVAPEQLATAQAAFAPLKQESGKPTAIMLQTPDEQAASRNRLGALYRWLQDHRAGLVAQTSAWEFDTVLLHARVLEQVAEYAQARTVMVKQAQERKVSPLALPEFGTMAGLRDVFMAENVAAQLAMLGPGARMAVGGHNGHVQLGPWGEGIPDFPGGNSIPAMGGFLRERLGEGYYALGFDFDRGAFQANEPGKQGAQEFVMPSAPEGSAASYLRQAGFDQYLIDLRPAPRSGPVSDWLTRPLGIAMLTGQFSRDRKRETSQAFLALGENFDGLLFVQETTRARSNTELK